MDHQFTDTGLFFFRKVLIVLVLETSNKFWGENIKKIGVILVLAMALLSVPVLSQGIPGDGGFNPSEPAEVGIFEPEGSAFEFPESQDTNIDTAESTPVVDV
jgi:hypothetical protein